MSENVTTMKWTIRNNAATSKSLAGKVNRNESLRQRIQIPISIVLVSYTLRMMNYKSISTHTIQHSYHYYYYYSICIPCQINNGKVY